MDINAAYYPSWKVYKDFPPSTLQIDKLTHVFYAFARVNENGTLRSLDPYADFTKPVDDTNGTIQALLNLRSSHPTLKIILSIGGGASSGTTEFPALASKPETRLAFAKSSKEWVDRYNFDGIDIDWEHPTTSTQGSDYLSLLLTARSLLPSPRYLLTSALPTGNYTLGYIDLSAVGQVLDYLNLMTYDFAGPWTPQAGNHAQLRPYRGVPQGSITAGIDNIKNNSNFPLNKIILGIPTFARYFPAARGPGDPFPKNTSGEIDYRDLPTEWITSAVIDKKKGAAHIVDATEGGKGFVSFDVPETVKIKVAWAKKQGLAGLFYWTGVADRTEDLSLIQTGFEALGIQR
ncbi:glycoside hydrolase family 18 protein [Podospora fimiseda]|uniref:chitinase n=1 Tax=Podospora fimiseda TaxID=252190 RepID=A0AAN6YLN7_9PEZI|nr:glycoside hydrolase family 18 protein [Podospora fimiseda]